MYTYFNEADKNIWGLSLENCLRLVLYAVLIVANLCPLRLDLISGNLLNDLKARLVNMEGDDAGQCCFGTKIRCDSKKRVKFSHKLALRTNPKVFRAMVALLEQVWGLP